MTRQIVVADRVLASDIQLTGWVSEVAKLTKPDRVVWCDGSFSEWERLTGLLVEQGTFTRLNPQLRPNSFHCACDPGDVARVEDRTFICSEKQEDAGPTNNVEAEATLIAEHLSTFGSHLPAPLWDQYTELLRRLG